jgi:VWFA-related protein
MASRRNWAALVLLGCNVVVGKVCAQDAPLKLTVTTRLVVLDATVLDKEGRVVTQPLGRDDFKIEEDKKPQAIYSFESANEHEAAMASGDAEKAPTVIFVLDDLDYAYNAVLTDTQNTMLQAGNEDYERKELIAFLEQQPATLKESTEVLALSHHGFQIVAQPTRDRGAVVQRVRRHNPGLGSAFRDYLEESGGNSRMSADHTTTRASMGAIWALALRERGEPGRKLVVWLGVGGPQGQAARAPRGNQLTPMELYSREITDVLVDARITLDVIGPGGGPPAENAASVAQQISGYRFESDFGFGGYVAATGGEFKDGNDVRGGIQASVNYGSAYYTMSYRPTSHDLNGDFRRIRVTVKGHPDWTVLTKAGYFALPFGGAKDQETQLQNDLSVATFEAMPFSAVNMTLTKIERIEGTDQARFTFQLDSDDLTWKSVAASAKQEADVVVSGAALGTAFLKNSLASQVATWKLLAPEGVGEGAIDSRVTLTLHVPEKTKRLRFVVKDLSTNRMGTVDLNPMAVEKAPEILVSTPPLRVRDGGKE